MFAIFLSLMIFVTVLSLSVMKYPKILFFILTFAIFAVIAACLTPILYFTLS